MNADDELISEIGAKIFTLYDYDYDCDYEMNLLRHKYM